MGIIAVFAVLVVGAAVWAFNQQAGVAVDEATPLRPEDTAPVTPLTTEAPTPAETVPPPPEPPPGPVELKPVEVGSLSMSVPADCQAVGPDELDQLDQFGEDAVFGSIVTYQYACESSHEVVLAYTVEMEALPVEDIDLDQFADQFETGFGGSSSVSAAVEQIGDRSAIVLEGRVGSAPITVAVVPNGPATPALLVLAHPGTSGDSAHRAVIESFRVR